MPTTSQVRLFESDPWAGPRLKARKLDKSLLAIKPKNCRIVVKRQKSMERRHGKRIEGLHFSNGHHTLFIIPTAEKETIAHEFGHAALDHKSRVKRTARQQIRRELAAWNWAYEHWAEPNKVKTGILKDRKRWISHVINQTMEESSTDARSTAIAVEKEMKQLKMKPLTDSEVTWIIRETKAEDKALRKTGWEPKYYIPK